jgi:adenine-specific DNA-methyltransferase
MYSCVYTPIKGRNEGKEIEVLYKVGSTPNQRNMVMFLSDVVEKIDDNYYYMDRITTLWDDIEYNNLTKEGNIEFSNGKKPIKLLKRIAALATDETSIAMDFFAGSGSTAHAIMQLNAEDGGHRKFIMVQLPEECDEQSEALKAGYKTIAEISKERIRRAGKQIKEENPEASGLDTGFRVLKVDSSNMADVYYTPDAVSKDDLFEQVEHIKADRNAEDLLFQIMLNWDVDLSLPIRKETIEGKEVYFVNDDDLVACFDKDIDEALIKALAAKEPLRAVFRDDGFVSDSVKINVEQIFKQLAPATEIKVI